MANSSGQSAGVCVLLGLVLTWICTMVGMGGSLHEVDTSFGGASSTVAYHYDEARTSGATIKYADCKDNTADDTCKICYDGGSIWITIVVFEFLISMFTLVLGFARSFGKSQSLSFSTPDRLWILEWRLYVVLASLFFIASIVWGGSCLAKTVDNVNESADLNSGVSYTIRATGYAFHEFMFVWLAVMCCLMYNATLRGPAWVTPFAPGAQQAQPPVATTVVVAAAPVAQPGQPVYAAPGQPVYAAPGQPVVYAAPTDQYGQPVVYAPQPAYGQPAYGQPAYGQPAYGQPVGQPVAYAAAPAQGQHTTGEI